MRVYEKNIASCEVGNFPAPHCCVMKKNYTVEKLYVSFFVQYISVVVDPLSKRVSNGELWGTITLACSQCNANDPQQ